MAKKKKQKQPQDPPPTWNPREGFPLQYDEASLETRLGILIALLEHQQVYALRKVGATLADRNLRAIARAPDLHLARVMFLGHHHEARAERDGRGRGRGLRHAELIDELMVYLPAELPKFVPSTRRWEVIRAYRCVRAHLKNTWGAWVQEYWAWRDLRDARNENYEKDPDLDAEDEDGEEDAA